MAGPPRAIKLTKGGVEYLNNVDYVKWTISELKMAALREVGRYLAREARDRVSVYTGTLRKAIGYFARKKTGDLQIGVYLGSRARKKGLRPAPHAHLIEFGTVKTAKRPFIEPAVIENIDTVRKIEAQYLSALSNEQEARRLIDDTWEEVDGTADE